MGGDGACLLLAATAERDSLPEMVSVATLFSDSRRFRLTMSSLEVLVPVHLARTLITAGEILVLFVIHLHIHTYIYIHTHTQTNTHT